MGSKWRKAKLALGRNLCVAVPQAVEGPPSPSQTSERLSDAALLSPTNWDMASSRPDTPIPSSNSFRLSKSDSKSSKQTCSICLTKIKQGSGHAIFTAECSHSFHFHCIASNVKHGNQICPVCRAKWKEIPLLGSSLDSISGRVPISPIAWVQNDTFVNVVRRLPPPALQRDTNHRHAVPLSRTPEPSVFNDDESINYQPVSSAAGPCSKNILEKPSVDAIEIDIFPERSAAPKSNSYSDFNVLVHLKAIGSFMRQYASENHIGLPQVSQNPRAPVDLVTVLDISGSMAGTKLALLKRAMGFVIQNLSSNDRLSVIAFSSTACRLFPLLRMTDSGRQQALQAVNSLIANGGTNIAEGLRKGVKIMEDRKQQNPVASIILLSDGQDTYTVSSSGGNKKLQPNYQLLLPSTICGGESTGIKIPVHAFGFGADHDSSSMHSISETSGGTFSFIETEAVIQDAFAQCIGGLLSVMVQELRVDIECVHPNISLVSLKAGSYPSHVIDNGCKGSIIIGDLYANEERDFLVSLNVPSESRNKTSLIKVRCVYKVPLNKEISVLESAECTIERPEVVGDVVMSLEVDRQRNRLQAAESIAEARVVAEQGDLSGAVSILENCRRRLSETASAKSHDCLCVLLDAELKEMQERMVSRHAYEASGRAYILSGLSSHSWQRATARGDSSDSSSLAQVYQTPSMVEMVTRSQAMLLGSPSTQGLLQPLLSFSSQPKPK